MVSRGETDVNVYVNVCDVNDVNVWAAECELRSELRATIRDCPQGVSRNERPVPKVPLLFPMLTNLNGITRYS